MSAAPCFMCKGTRWIRMGGGPWGQPLEAPCIACNADGAVKPAATTPELGSVQQSQPLKLYRPSNGTEGDIFRSRFCDRCERDRAFREEEPGATGCTILCATLTFDVDEPEYPREWCRDADNKPTCTAFVPEGELAPPRDTELEDAGQATLF